MVLEATAGISGSEDAPASDPGPVGDCDSYTGPERHSILGGKGPLVQVYELEENIFLEYNTLKPNLIHNLQLTLT